MRKLSGALGVLLALSAIAAGAARADPLAPQMHTVASGIGLARSVAEVPGGGFLYVDAANDLVREVSASGQTSTVAGNGTLNDVDGGSALDSGLNGPVSVAVLPGGGFLITEFNGSVVRMVAPDGTISTIAGTGSPSPNTTTSGPATAVGLDYPTDAEPTADGSVLIADTYDNVIRDVSPSGVMTTIAGGGGCDDVTAACDGMPAGSVALDHPDSVSPVQGGSGGYLIAEYDGAAIREVSQASGAGVFTTVAGTPGQAGYGGDGGAATAAQLDHPQEVLSTGGGGFLIADTNNERIRAVSPAGVISTVAGNGVASYAGDGGDATAASLNGPAGVSTTPDGGFLIADANNGAIRAVSIPPTTTISFTPTGNDGWFDTPASVTITSTNAKKINCEVDPPAPPPAFAAIPSGCSLAKGTQVTGDGTHTIYAAGQDALGDQEIPVSASLKIDATPPTLTCVGVPTFVFGTKKAVVTATVADSGSGPVSPTASGLGDAFYLGQYGVTIDAYDRAGNLGRVGCTYNVVPTVLRPSPRLAWSFSTSANHATSIRRLVALRVPARAAVNVTCRGGGCPFSSRRNVGVGPKRPRSGTRSVSLASLFTHAALARGVSLSVSVTEANAIGRAWLFTLSGSAKASPLSACLQPGSLTARRRCKQ